MGVELDVFDDDWTKLGDDNVLLDPVKGFDVVPVSRGFVAFRLATLEGADRVPHASQAVVSPDYARRMAAALIAAANLVNPSN